MSASSKKKLRKEQNAAQLTEKQQQEKKEAKKLKVYTIAFVTLMVLVVSVTIGIFAYRSIENSGIIQRNTVAMTVNDHKITSAQMNYYYVDTINSAYQDWYNDYKANTQMAVMMFYNLDLTKPLNTQNFDTEGKLTWAEYFADMAANDVKSAYTLYDLAKKAGHTLTEDEQKQLDNSLKTTSQYATMLYGYPDFESYLKVVYGKGATEKTYREYMEVSALAQSYYNAYADSLTYEDADLREYEKEHYDDFSSFDFVSFHMPVSIFTPKDKDGKTLTTDEAKEQAQKAAAEAAETLKNSKADSAMLLNKAISKLEVYKDNDKAVSTENEHILLSNIADPIAEWLAADGRKAGELAVLPNTVTSKDADGKETSTIDGYYVVIYLARDDNNTNLVNVRHILANFEGGTTNDKGEKVYSEAEKQKAKEEIEKVLETWEAGEKTADSFAALAKEKSDDTGSAKNGGLYENVYPGQMVKNFNDWCFDESRKAGDYEIVETEYGYHLIYFVNETDTTYRDYMIKLTMSNEDLSAWYKDALEKASMEVKNISHLSLDYVVMSN